MPRASNKVTATKRTLPRRRGEPLTPEEIAEAQRIFTTTYAKYGNVSDACKRAAISRNTYYRWQENDEPFHLATEQAKQTYCDTLRHEINRRARDGVLKPVYQQGKKVGAIREYSDTLLIFQAKAHMPEYREKVQVEQSGQVSVRHDIADSPEAALYASLFVAAVHRGGEGDTGGPRISRE